MSGLAQRWVTLDGAVTATGRSRRTITRWIHQRRLAAQTVGGTRYVRELDVLIVEQRTRHTARAGRPGARPPRQRMALALGLAAAEDTRGRGMSA